MSPEYTNATPQVQPAVDESIANSHRTLGRIEYVLESLLADLNGSPSLPGEACDQPSSGLVADADRLATRVDCLSGLVDRVKARLIGRNVVELAQKAQFAGSSNSIRGY